MTRPDAWSEIVQLLRMRYFLTERVYYHHTKVVAGAMISKAVELALASAELAEADLLELGDWSLFARLRAGSDPAIGHILDRLERRRLLKRGYVLSSKSLDAPQRQRFVDLYHSSLETRGAAERELAAALNAPEHDVIVYCPALTVMKEASALARTARGILPMTDIDPAGASEIGALARRHEALWRMYVFVPQENLTQTVEVAAELFGHRSEHEMGSGN